MIDVLDVPAGTKQALLDSERNISLSVREIIWLSLLVQQARKQPYPTLVERLVDAVCATAAESRKKSPKSVQLTVVDACMTSTN